MTSRLLAALGATVLVLGAAGGTAWWFLADQDPATIDLTVGEPKAGDPNARSGDPASGDLPLPPFPPRISDSDRYDVCMTMLVADPEGAEAIAATWQASGGGNAAAHCKALATIANGEPEAGAAMLESLAHDGKVTGLTRVVLLSQAAEARLMADQAGPALRDSNEALAISPDDPDLLIGRAQAHDALGQVAGAMGDLDRALLLDPSRTDALVLRAAVWRRMDKLDEARSDIDKAIVLDPDDAEALLERGIVRQLKGDLTGARQDWTRARDVDPNSTAAELAAQNLTLLDAGPDKK